MPAIFIDMQFNLIMFFSLLPSCSKFLCFWCWSIPVPLQAVHPHFPIFIDVAVSFLVRTFFASYSHVQSGRMITIQKPWARLTFDLRTYCRPSLRCHTFPSWCANFPKFQLCLNGCNCPNPPFHPDDRASSQWLSINMYWRLWSIIKSNHFD